MQGSVHRPPAGGDDIHHPHGSAQQVYGGGGLFVFAVQVDAQLHLGGTLAVQLQAIRRQLQRAALPGGSPLPLQVEAPLAKGHPGRPVAVHQNPHLGLHGGARRSGGVPAGPQGVKQRHRDGRAGVAAVGHIAALYQIQHDAAPRHGYVVQFAAHKSLGVPQ